MSPLLSINSNYLIIDDATLGTIVSIYMLGFVIWKSVGWGIHWNTAGASCKLSYHLSRTLVVISIAIYYI